MLIDMLIDQFDCRWMIGRIGPSTTIGRESSLEQRNASISASLATAQRKLDDATAALQANHHTMGLGGGILGLDSRNGMSAAAQLADQQLADALEELNGERSSQAFICLLKVKRRSKEGEVVVVVVVANP